MRVRAGLRAAVLSVLSVTFFTLGIETAARGLFHHWNGHTYFEHHAFLPHPQLVYQNNPAYFLWKHRPRQRDGFFFIPPINEDELANHVWVLGGSTSAAMPDRADWPDQLDQMLRGDEDESDRIVNMGHEGYGTSQLHWLYEHARDHVRPAAVVVLDGWNYRGAMVSRTAFKPLNTPGPFDSMLVRLSAWLMDHSCVYGSLVAHYRKLHPDPNPCGLLDPYPEQAEWAAEERALISEMAARDRVYVVMYPGLAMRDDVQPLLGRGADQRCVAEHFQFYRAEYEGRLSVLREAAQAAHVPLVDARAPYLALDAAGFLSCFRDYCHQTAEGNRLLATAIRAELSRLGVLPAAGGRHEPRA